MARADAASELRRDRGALARDEARAGSDRRRRRRASRGGCVVSVLAVAHSDLTATFHGDPSRGREYWCLYTTTQGARMSLATVIVLNAILDLAIIGGVVKLMRMPFALSS